MIVKTVYFVITIILVFIIYIAIKAANVGIRAKKKTSFSKIKNKKK